MSPSPGLVIDTDAWTAASKQFGQNVAGVLDTGYSDIASGTLAQAVAGGDPAGKAWYASYTKVGNLIYTMTDELADASRKFAQLLEQTGFNHGYAESASDPRGVVAEPPDKTVYPVRSSPLPTFPIGGSTLLAGESQGDPNSVPDLWGLVSPFTSQHYPDGNVGSIRTAGNAWSNLADVYDEAAGLAQTAGENIVLEQSPEVQDALAACDGMQTKFQKMAGACRAIDRSCQQFASNLDRTQHKIHSQLLKVSIAGGIITVLGVVLTIPSGGSSDAAGGAGAAAVAAEVDVTIEALATESLESVTTVTAEESTIGEVATEIEPLLNLDLETADVLPARSVTDSGFWDDDTLATVRLEKDASPLWSKAASPRGFEAEDILTPGHDLPPNYPGIDDLEDGNAISDKTIDVTAKSYQEGGGLRSTVRGYINKLVNFKARPYGGADIQPGDVTSRTLRIGVQKGAVSPAQANIFQEMETYAQSKGIALEIVEIP